MQKAAIWILLLAAGLRLYALDFGLPLAEARPDELTIAFQAMKFGTFDFNPHSFNYPSLFKYVVFGLFGGWYVIGRLIGLFGGQEEFLRSFFTGAVSFRLIMRLLSALMGTLNVWLLLRLPAPPAQIDRAGPVAALFLALSFLHVRDSHFGVTDVTMVCLATAAVLLAQRMHRLRTPDAALIAGVVAGLCTSTKYNGALLALPLALAALLPSPGMPWAPDRGRLSRLGLAAAAMIGGFLLGTPYALLDAPTFWQDFSYEARHLAAGHYLDIGIGWVHHVQNSLRYGMGLPALVVAGVGVLWHLWRDPRQAALLYSFPVAYYLLIGRGETAFFRYILPVIPFLCIAAGHLLARLFPRGRTALLLALLLLSPSLQRSLSALRLMGHGDTRDAMGAWIEQNVPDEARIVHAGAYTGAPMLQRSVENQMREYQAKAGRSDVAGFRKPDDPRWYDRSRPTYDVLFVRKEGIEFASQLSVGEIVAEPPEWLMLEDYFLIHYSHVPEEIREMAARGYTLAHEEIAWEGDLHPIFDQQDAFYLPVDGFKGFSRMGPTLRIYRRSR